jgi:hypothetical protein
MGRMGLMPFSGRGGRLQRVGFMAIIATAATMATWAPAAASPSLGFSTVYVDGASGGGEGFVIVSHSTNRLVYSAHAGTTLTKSGNAPGGTNCDINPSGLPSGYLCSYDNQVNIWSSSDQGQTWTKSLGNPTYTGFSDPSLSEDECTPQGACNIYDTGIDLVNDALYASPDGGQTWVAGTPQCHDGDRPWLAGGKHGEVFMATNANTGGHTLYKGTVTQVNGQNATLQCSPTPQTAGIPDSGGVGQIYYNHHNGELIEPKLSGGHIGIGVLPDASNANWTGTGTPSTFLNRASTGPTYGSIFAHWPAIAISTDANTPTCTENLPTTHCPGTIYAVWDTDPRSSTPPLNGCSGLTGSAIGGNTLLQNAVMLTYSQDDGLTWSSPTTIVSTGGTVQWPWVSAGANGNVVVTWYQGNQVSDPDCDSANIVCGTANPCPTQWSIAAETLYGVTGGSPTIQRVNAIQNFDGKHANGTMHVGGVCEGGTTCVATGEDRRIGDFFTNALDQNGCAMIASGDTQQVSAVSGQQLPNSLPLFLHQNSGPSLTTGIDCASFVVVVPETVAVPLLGAVGVLILAVMSWWRRRPRRATG